MKKIHKSAEEYEDFYYSVDEPASLFKAFVQGVKFSEEWTLVSEEYPNKENGYEDEPVLCKIVVGSIQPKTEYPVSVCNRHKFKCETDWVFVESWRPIYKK